MAYVDIGQRLHDVVRSTLVAGLIYSSPSWWGFAGAADRVRLQAVLTRIGQLGYLPEGAPSIEQICTKADKALFASVCHNPDHVLSRLLPLKKESVHALRPRVHNRVLPEAGDRMRRTFRTRMLYSDYRIYSPISRFKYKSKCNFGGKIAFKINGSHISRI